MMRLIATFDLLTNIEHPLIYHNGIYAMFYKNQSIIIESYSFNLMKITVKKKSLPSKEQTCNQELNNFCSQASSNVKIPLKRVHSAKNAQEQIQQFINIESRYSLSRINENSEDVNYLINKVLKSYKITYTHEFGCLCAHVARHFSIWTGRQTGADLQIMKIFIQKYNAIFMNSGQPTLKNNGKFQSFDQVVAYGKQCVAFNLLSKYYNLEQKDKEITTLVSRYVKSLFFEFIPPEYSSILINLFLGNSSELNEIDTKVMFQNNEKYSFLNPYHEFFCILSSLLGYVLLKKNPINLDHFIEICNNAYMGVVEWPIILGNRYLHPLPTL